jgi:hypothetical protein
MQDPQAYFNTIAQMIVQSAAASAAQDEARMQREQDLAYRREQMGLERERMADQRRLTDTQVEGQKLINKRNARIDENESRADATAFVDDEMERMETGEIPEQRRRRLVREKQDLELGTARDEATVRSLEAENAPKAISLKNSAAEEQIKASKAAQSLDAYRLESEKAMEGFRKASAEAQLRGANIANSNATLELGKARRNELYARLGLTTPEQKAALGANFDADLQRAFINAAEKSAIKTDAMGNQVFDMDEFQKSLTKVEAIGEASAKFKMLQNAQPDQAKKIQGALKIMADQLIRTTSDPDAVGQALVTSLGAMVDAAGGNKSKTDKVDTTPKQKPPGELTLRSKSAQEEKEKGRKIRVEGKRQKVSDYLNSKPEMLQRVRDAVTQRVGDKDLVTDQMVIDYVLSIAAPEGGNVSDGAMTTAIYRNTFAPSK